MTTPFDAEPADVAEQHQSPTRDDEDREAPDLPLEATAADVAEQAVDAGPGTHRATRDLPLETDDLDAAEQAVVVEQDEDEGR